MSLPPDEIITFEDCRRAGYCLAGVRRFIERRGGSFDDFAANGMTVAEAMAWQGEDALVLKVISHKAAHPNGER